MAKVGRPRKSDYLKKLEGNPGQRPLNEDMPEVDGKPVCPACLKGYAREAWNRIISSMPPNIYGRCDTELLSAYCAAAKLHHEAIINLEKDGPIYYGESGYPCQNQWVSILNNQAKLMATIGSRLGLDPAARSSLKVPSGKEKSKFSGLRGIQDGQKKVSGLRTAQSVKSPR